MSETTTELPTHGVNSTGGTDQGPHPLEQEGRTDLCLRISLSRPGGCSGLILPALLTSASRFGDAVRDFDGVEVIVDKMSALTRRSTIDFEDNTVQGFHRFNPAMQHKFLRIAFFH